MSGECSECGNAICMCDYETYIDDTAIVSSFYDADYVKKLQNQLKDAEEVIRVYSNPVNYNMDSSFIEDDDELSSYINESQWEIGNKTKYTMQDYVGGKKAREYFKKHSLVVVLP